ncbi:MAG: N-acetylmuramoyl-L-alanine amidase [Oscillochloridaceae bacterium umkhey_bin13]
MKINWVGMTRQHYQVGRPGPIRALVIHATAGRHPGDLGWLRKGGDERRPVSCHYYIDKAGTISQLVRDEDTAWHAGVSRWPIDGKLVNGLNATSIGIELENLNSGRDPYPEVQLAATVALSRELVRRYNLPRGQLVRHLDISPGRKTDPAGFPWPSFVAQVYADLDSAVSPERQLHALMLDLAYRAAGGALPAVWPLRDLARRRDLGMPVAVLRGASPIGSSAPDDQERAVQLIGQPPLLVEAYARDLIYAPLAPDGSAALRGQERRLAETPPGALRNALLELLFRAADPANGFRADWVFHQHYLERPGALGVPLGPSHRLTLPGGQSFTCQHFALDSLCSLVGSWQTVYRLSELTRPQPGLDAAVAAALRRSVLDDLYRVRTGRRYDQAALLVQQAEQRRLGAPLGRPELVLVAGTPYVLLPFALDLLAVALPAPDWPLERALPEASRLFSLRTLERDARPWGGGGAGGGARPQPMELLNGLLQAEPAEPAELVLAARPLLGPPSPQPSVLDLSPPVQGRRRRPGLAPEALLITATPGPAAVDLRHEAALGRWHYYLDTSGAIYRLCDEIYLSAAVGRGPLAERAIVIAVEGGPHACSPPQWVALSWLVRALATALRIPPAAIRALAA